MKRILYLIKRILGMDPLEITILRCGTFKEYELSTGKQLRHINPPVHDVRELVRAQEHIGRSVRRWPLA